MAAKTTKKTTKKDSSLDKPSPEAIGQAYDLLKANGVSESLLKKALPIVLAKKPRPYETNFENCSCPYFVATQSELPLKQRQPCKHMVAKAILDLAKEFN